MELEEKYEVDEWCGTNFHVGGVLLELSNSKMCVKRDERWPSPGDGGEIPRVSALQVASATAVGQQGLLLNDEFMVCPRGVEGYSFSTIPTMHEPENISDTTT